MHDDTTNEPVDNGPIITDAAHQRQNDETLQPNNDVTDVQHDHQTIDDNANHLASSEVPASSHNHHHTQHHNNHSLYEDDLVNGAIDHVDDKSQPDLSCADGIVDVDENDFVDPTTTPNENDEYSASKMLDGEKMLEVTRKLFRSTERDPDRDLRKQVLLKTALKNLPHYVHYQQYSTDRDQEQQYDDFDESIQQYNNNLQPNAIEVSTTSMRMLDLNDDYDQSDELDRNNVENHQQSHHPIRQNHLDDDDATELGDHFDHNTVTNLFDDILFNRHNSFDNLYNPNELNESEDSATTTTNHHISWNIGYKIFEFPSIDAVSKVSKILDDEEFQGNQQHTKEQKFVEKSSNNEPTVDDRKSSVVNESTASSSSADESLTTSDTSNGEEEEDQNATQDLIQSLRNSFHPVSSSPRSNKRRSSFDYADSMEIDLADAEASQLFATSPFGQFKRLRKNFEKQTAPLIETTTGGF